MGKIKSNNAGGVYGAEKELARKQTSGKTSLNGPTAGSAFKAAPEPGASPTTQQPGFLGRSMVDQMSRIKQKTQTMINMPRFAKIPKAGKMPK